ncbi:MAG: serine/threonine-protein kinase [Myxococcota bacterium]
MPRRAPDASEGAKSPGNPDGQWDASTLIRTPGADDLGDQLNKAKVAASLFDTPVQTFEIGRFTLLARIGAGGMGEVFSAYDSQLDRKVAIKLVRPDVDRPNAERDLLREAQAVAQLSHPHVVQIYEVGTYGERVFIAMEFLTGQSLKAWAKQTHRWQDKLEVLLQVAQGLSAAHRAHIVHRDVTPNNVLVGDDDRARLIDFGLARTSAAGTSADTSNGSLHTSLAGTPAYMAPETTATLKSDQFGFCTTGRASSENGRCPYKTSNAVAQKPNWSLLSVAVVSGAI